MHEYMIRARKNRHIDMHTWVCNLLPLLRFVDIGWRSERFRIASAAVHASGLYWIETLESADSLKDAGQRCSVLSNSHSCVSVSEFSKVVDVLKGFGVNTAWKLGFRIRAGPYREHTNGVSGAACDRSSSKLLTSLMKKQPASLNSGGRFRCYGS